MFERRVFTMLALGIVVAGGLAGCEKMKSMVGMGGATSDFRNAQIDVADTPCADNAKFSTLVLQDGKYVLGNYQFELFGDTKRGDVTGHTQTGSPESSVFVGNCAIDGQTSQVLFVYGNDANGKFARLGATNLTDNGNGLVQSFDIGNSMIYVEQNQGNPPKLTKTAYALLNGKLTNLAPNASAPSEAGNGSDMDIVSFQVFHDKLQSYGSWIKHPRWGDAWRPSNQAGFRPYENGHWENSDEYGATWVSADPWGDTPTHYGRWGYDPHYGGWLWVPGYVWGPGWVTWRTSDENVGWFPIPPGEWNGEGEYVDNWDGWYGYRGVLDEAAFFGLWSFVAPGDIFYGDIRGRIIDRRGYGRFMGRTRGWSRFGVSHGHIVNRAFERGRFHEAFHRDLPGSRHDFAGRHVTSVAAGHRVEHEHGAIGHGGEGNHGGFHTADFHGGAGHGTTGGFGRGGGAGMARSGGGFGHHENGFSRGGSNGFARSGGGGNGFGRSGGGGNGFGRTGGGNAMGGFNRSGGGGNGHGNGGLGGGGGNAFGHAGGGGGGMGGFGHAAGGGFGGGHAAAPVQHSGGGGGNHHH